MPRIYGGAFDIFLSKGHAHLAISCQAGLVGNLNGRSTRLERFDSAWLTDYFIRPCIPALLWLGTLHVRLTQQVLRSAQQMRLDIYQCGFLPGAGPCTTNRPRKCAFVEL